MVANEEAMEVLWGLFVVCPFGQTGCKCQVREIRSEPLEDRFSKLLNMKRVSRKINFHNQRGLHMRPAALVVRIAHSFESTIFILKAEDRADARSIFDLLILGIMQGDPVEIPAAGRDAEEALDAISDFLSTYEDTVMARDTSGRSGFDSHAA